MIPPESIEPGATTKRITGSTFIAQAENIETVRTKVEADIYYTEGVVSRSPSFRS
jgi:uncharacterized protein YciI